MCGRFKIRDEPRRVCVVKLKIRKQAAAAFAAFGSHLAEHVGDTSDASGIVSFHSGKNTKWRLLRPRLAMKSYTTWLRLYFCLAHSSALTTRLASRGPQCFQVFWYSWYVTFLNFLMVVAPSCRWKLLPHNTPIIVFTGMQIYTRVQDYVWLQYVYSTAIYDSV